MLKTFYTQFTSDVCRVCLEGENATIPLFDASATEKSFVSFADMLNQCSNVQAIDGDELPAFICLPCKESLTNAYKFKSLAEESDNILRQKKEVKPKITFQNLNELKLKIEEKSLIEHIPAVECNKNIYNIVEKGGAIGNTLIQKVKKEEHSDNDMEVEYLDEDFVVDSPPKKKRPVRVRQSTKAYTVIATIKGLDNVVDLTDDDAKYCTLKEPIPIVSSNMTKEKLQKARKLPKRSGFIAPLGKKIKIKSNKSGTKREKKVVPKEKVKHVCSICGLQTVGIKSHLLTHLESKPFKCEQCSKSFAQRGNYVMHLKKHNGVKDQICEICGAAFYFHKSVKRHKMIHTKDRKFNCHLCPKKFYAKCDLNRHLKVHSGYKPFKCETCSVMFNAKHQLEAHIRMHTGEKPYTCEICNVSFTYKVNLNNHVYKNHGVNLKYKSIYKITPDVLSELYQQESENAHKEKSLPAAE